MEYLATLIDLNSLKEPLLNFGPRAIFALITLYFGWKFISLFRRFLSKRFDSLDIDPTLKPYLESLLTTLAKAALVISVASMIGVETTSFVAVLGAAGLAVGLALQGSLSNFAGGALILIFRPFHVGDFIEAQGHSGTVTQIQIFNTVILTGDYKTVIIPNGPLASGSLINYSTQKKRRIDFVFGISYADNIDFAKSTLVEILSSDQRIHKDPVPFVVVKELGDSSVNILARVWVDSGEYWDVYFSTLETVKKTFDAKGISFPFPQRELHITNSEAIKAA